MCSETNAKVLVDASTTLARVPIDVSDLGIDFLVASGHTAMGPTGSGFLWADYKTLSSMTPWQGGGEMIDEVFLEESTYAPPPGRFEAGTPAIAESVGLGASATEIMTQGIRNIYERELKFGTKLVESLGEISGLRIVGSTDNRLSIASFNVQNIPPSRLQELLMKKGFEVSAGFHSSQPLHDALKLHEGSVRVSFGVSNTEQDIARFVKALGEVVSKSD
mmetsp:Transcript_22108/g.39196  ORF Transcript_22108/g.39196 Transcript_22108/m.39196 type:complete len:220 (+) Transcript_22108:349-1008(+)